MSSNNVRPAYMLNESHFIATILLALAVHLLALLGWSLAPKTEVRHIPIHIMNIRFEDVGTEELEAPQALSSASTGNAPQVESLVDQITREALLKKLKPVARNDSSARQYVREVSIPNAAGSPRSKASGARDAELLSRYTQLISLWIQKFKVYPEEARQRGIIGESVVRIRVDRRGNVRYYALERTTGSEVLDRAAIDMIRRANPVPAVPNDYPEGELQEFLIPVSFK